MSFRAWKLVSGVIALLLLLITAGYTWLVFAKASWDVWAWWHQLVATCVSVRCAAAIGIWLYMWQTEKTNAARKTELRIAQLIGIFDIWDRIRDANLQDADFPDGVP